MNEINKKASDLSIIFMGTPKFAVPALEAVHKEFGVKAVVTTSDKPKGRGLNTLPSDVKNKAMELNIPIFQPEKLKDTDFIDAIKSLRPDIILVIAFRILPKELFSLAKIASVNIHGSLLPKYRGAAPINWAIMNGEKQTGLTSFLLNEKVDTGSILLRKYLDITDGMTAGELHDALMPVAAELSLETCRLLITRNFQPEIQDNSQSSPAPKIFPEMCKIDWEKDELTVRNFIHGLSPNPGAWTIFHSKRLKILRVKSFMAKKLIPGEYSIEADLFLIGTSGLCINIIELQPDGKRIMNVTDFIRGYRDDKKGYLE